MPIPVLLSCTDPLDGRRPDPHFVPEVRAARELGALVGLIDHDALLAGYPGDAVRLVPANAGPAWYRGWMIPSARYAALEAALFARGTPLLTTGAQYRTAHELPGWYRVFEGTTPRSGWVGYEPGYGPEGEPEQALPVAAITTIAAELVAAGATAGVVKDYVKSAKHRWATACYVPDLADPDALERVVTAFVAEQAEFLAGGIVLREFEDFTGLDDAPAAQARVWWLDDRPVLLTAHPDNPRTVVEPDLTEVARRVAALPARFVVTDVVRRRDGIWRVVEVGDGQVSDLPVGQSPAPLLAALLSEQRADSQAQSWPQP